MRSFFVNFRGQDEEVIIDSVVREPDVNYYELNWYFSKDDLNKGLTDKEEEEITTTCWKFADENGL